MRSIILFCCMALLAASASAVELLTWARMPLSIKLHVDEERVVFIDRNVSIGVDGNVTDILRVQTAAGTIYLKALDTLPPTRLQIKDAETGEIILLDVETVDGKEPLEPVRILDAQSVRNEERKKELSYEEAAKDSVKIPAPVALVRYAAQSLYAPLRTVKAIPGLRKIPLRVSHRLRLLPTKEVIGSPLVAYTLGDYTVTAVQLVNLSKEVLPLDPRHLQGDFYAAAFQHPFLGANGSAEDTTVAYLVTHNKQLDRALLPSSLLIEAKPEPKPETTDSAKEKP